MVPVQSLTSDKFRNQHFICWKHQKLVEGDGEKRASKLKNTLKNRNPHRGRLYKN